ncbi:DUF6851 domain-containing protein [Fulvivirga sedimenti]|uniref:T9SS type A sorting domain-containing protein n=1 Tax=Fulvivirga sedimenti TaxID=2879465 RepID=A0A9X1HNH4_9BACT|nr:T9SS type A sorting domain-containing protein [Fulvivirga sedimenti]MCA6074816.1 T9SS type A sorting domain-containing protein [Fulvivirga sedimenti]MCA6075993.1 T9SS type A sorting domain-containing protein [Fulvivirga sedimenti]MCA6077121.1 T9SS type A sorting domain-containing protein [Fulvivirga sedimenti]
MIRSLILTILFLVSFAFENNAQVQHSIARQWNEVLLDAIRNDFARPTVHARNLFHVSAAMYDAWTVYSDEPAPWLLGNTRGNFTSVYSGIPVSTDIENDREMAISYAVYRLILHRFEFSPGSIKIRNEAFSLMMDLGYDPNVTGTDYRSGDPAQVGNYIASQYIAFGLTDGSNEQLDYINQYYSPVNPPLVPTRSGNPQIIDPNRWQPLFLDNFIDQSGNPIPVGQISFLSPEWGNVTPFAMGTSDRKFNERDGDTYWTYMDPGPPPFIQEDGEGTSEQYQWGFSLVAIWSAHLTPNDGVMWDISPRSLGNVTQLPSSAEEMQAYYDLINGGDPGTGYAVNPYTGAPYEPQMVKRGDYTRVLAEFWADGPDSETPPGHWFTILNYVNDQPELVKRFKGEGPLLDDLEWDIKTYFTLGGAMHDCAIAAWGVKGWYDYIRPVSAIRYMADKGQSTDPGDLSYHPAGIPLLEGYIELVREGDPLAGPQGNNIGKIKLMAWKGPDYIPNPEVDYADVDWILAENWWPYQRPTFVTPPFAGYVSGHSTYSRAAAEVLTMITGDPYFPRGMGEFIARKNEFLVFEEGPSEDVILQWATYRDASDQTSLSRIWGGIHPPADDIPGRKMGIKIGLLAFQTAEKIFNNAVITSLDEPFSATAEIFPNPVKEGSPVRIQPDPSGDISEIKVMDLQGKIHRELTFPSPVSSLTIEGFLSSGLYILQVSNSRGEISSFRLIVK